MENVEGAWEEFLNPDVVRAKLISAGLFLVGYEMLLDSIKRHPLSFYAETWTNDGPEQSEKYRDEVLSLDPQGKMDAKRGSIAWLRKMEAISRDDEDAIRSVTDARNEIAHEMSAMIGGSKPPEFAEQFTTLMELVGKIEKWWIINVEIPTNPDFDDEDIDENGIVSGPSWVMQLLHTVAFGEGEDAWEFYHEFIKRRGVV